VKKKDLEGLSDHELIEEFRLVAHKLGDSIVNWVPTTDEVKYLFTLTKALGARGRQVRLQLAPLLDDKDRFVRYYAAQELLALVPGRSRQIIEETAKGFDALAGDAGMLLHALDRDQWKPD